MVVDVVKRLDDAGLGALRTMVHSSYRNESPVLLVLNKIDLASTKDFVDSQRRTLQNMMEEAKMEAQGIDEDSSGILTALEENLVELEPTVIELAADANTAVVVDADTAMTELEADEDTAVTDVEPTVVELEADVDTEVVNTEEHHVVQEDTDLDILMIDDASEDMDEIEFEKMNADLLSETKKEIASTFFTTSALKNKGVSELMDYLRSLAVRREW